MSRLIYPYQPSNLTYDLQPDFQVKFPVPQYCSDEPYSLSPCSPASPAPPACLNRQLFLTEQYCLVPHQTVVIGYGNTLRSDDGAGQRVAELVQEQDLPAVRSHPVHQLTPELAAEIAQAKQVIFVDAFSYGAPGASALATEAPPAILVQSLGVTQTATSWGHTADPRSLLALTQALYGTVPPAWWILIPAVNFEFGEQFSAVTERGIVEALAKIRELLSVDC